MSPDRLHLRPLFLRRLRALAGLAVSALLAPAAGAAPANPEADLIPKFEAIAPRVPEREERSVELPAPPPRTEAKDDTVLVEKVRGFLFTADKSEVVPEGRTDIEGFRVSGLEILALPEFAPLITPYVGGPVSLNTLRKLVGEIVEFYRIHDEPVVDIVIPEQDITTGVIQILVLEGRVGEVRAEGNRWFSGKLLTSKVRLAPGDRIKATKLIQDIELLNVNPFRTVDVAFTPGADEGSSDIVLKTRDRFPVRFYTGYENNGNDLTGDERWLAGFNWGNALFQDHVLSYQFTTSSDFKNLLAHSVSYSMPFFRRDQFVLAMAHSTSESTLGPSSPTLFLGESWDGLVYYSIPLPSPWSAFSHDFIASTEFRRSQNDTYTADVLVREELTDICQAVLEYSVTLRDQLGFTSLKAGATFSPGGITDLNSDGDFATNRTLADARYTIYRLQARRQIQLPWKFSVLGSFNGQKADSSLLTSEQLALGGYDTVRGYEEGEVRGDEGYFFNLEFGLPPVSLGQCFSLPAYKDELRVFGFWDYGQVSNRTLLPDENPDTELSSAGVGLRYVVDRYLSVRADYGFQLLDTGLNNRFASRLHLGVTLSY